MIVGCAWAATPMSWGLSCRLGALEMWVQLWVGLLLSAFAADRQAELIDPRREIAKAFLSVSLTTR